MDRTGKVRPVELLLVEDDEAALAAVTDTLAGEGYVCHGARTLADARRLYFEHPRIGVIVADIGLAGESGLELPEQIRGDMLLRCPSFIFLTACDQIEVVVEAMRLGAADFLVKPVARDKLLATVDSVVEAYLAARRALTDVVAGWGRGGAPGPSAPEEAPAASNGVAESNDEPQSEAIPAATTDAGQTDNVRRIMQIRQDILRRDGMVAPWDADIDILLELLTARQAGRILSATKLMVSRKLPQTTILRHIDKLVERGLVLRSRDPKDCRRTNLEVTEEGARHVTAFAEQFCGVVLGQSRSDRAAAP